jgi:Ribbon-helix-helix protein, copG family
MTMAKKDLGQTRSGEPITDALVEELAPKAEAGFDVDEILRRRGGRPTMGSSAASVESVRLDPELSDALRERAEREGRTNSELIRDALRRYLQAS